MAKVCLYFQEIRECLPINSGRIKGTIPKDLYEKDMWAAYIAGKCYIDGMEISGDSVVFRIFELSAGKHKLTFKGSQDIANYGTVAIDHITFQSSTALVPLKPSGIFCNREFELDVKEGNNYFILTGFNHRAYVQLKIYDYDRPSKYHYIYDSVNEYTDSYDVKLQRSSAEELKKLMDKYGSQHHIAPELRTKRELKKAMEGKLIPNCSLMTTAEYRRAVEEEVRTGVSDYYAKKKKAHPVRTFFADARDKIFKRPSKTSFIFKLLYSLVTVIAYFAAFGLGMFIGAACVGTIESGWSMLFYVLGAAYAVVMTIITFRKIWNRYFSFSWAFMGLNALVPFALALAGAFL